MTTDVTSVTREAIKATLADVLRRLADCAAWTEQIENDPRTNEAGYKFDVRLARAQLEGARRFLVLAEEIMTTLPREADDAKR